jgi:signal transduction histidine kinase
VIRPLTIQFKLLIIFFVAAVVPIALVSLVSYHNSLKAVEEMVGNRTEELARSVGDDLSRRLRLRLRDKILLVNQPVQNFLASVNRRSPDRLRATMDLGAYASTLLKEYSLYYKDIIIADASGAPVYRFGRTEGPELATAFSAEEGEAPSSAAPSFFDSLSALIPEELPLPGQLRREVEEFGRSLQERLNREARPRAPASDGDAEDVTIRGLPSDVVSSVIGAFSDPSSPDVLADPDFVGPQPPTSRSRMGLLESLERYLTPIFSDDERLAARNAVRLGMDENMVYIHRTSSGDPNAIRLLRPIYSVGRENELLGAMILDIRVDYLFPEDLGAKRFGGKGDLAIVDERNGEILFHTRPELVGKNIRATNAILSDALRYPGGPAESGPSWIRYSASGGDRLASLSNIGTVPWAVVATSFPREFESEARGAGFINLLVATMALLLALGVLVISSRRISESVRRVTAGAREIAAGNLNHSIHVNTHDEIETLADAFNSMTIALRENISLRERAAEELAALNRTLEDRVQERTQELSALNEALNQANQELKELDRLKSNFLSTVSHEFRTPLTSITAFSEILIDEMEDHETSKEVMRFLNIINTESERLGRLIKNLLDLSRIEAGRMRWERSVFPVRKVMLAALDGLLPVFSEKDIRIVREVECPDALISADRDRIQQVITNLLENAMKFSERGKRIWIGCRQTGVYTNGIPWLQVTVRDEGPGIPRDHLVKIFERFSQVDTTDTRGTGGSGLGLAISKEIVEHHGGRIWAESDRGKGASFHFTLPVHTGPVPDETDSKRIAKEKEHA